MVQCCSLFFFVLFFVRRWKMSRCDHSTALCPPWGSWLRTSARLFVCFLVCFFEAWSKKWRPTRRQRRSAPRQRRRHCQEAPLRLLCARTLATPLSSALMRGGVGAVAYDWNLGEKKISRPSPTCRFQARRRRTRLCPCFDTCGDQILSHTFTRSPPPGGWGGGGRD